MNNMPSKKSLMSLALGSAFAATLGTASVVSAGDTPFAVQSLDKGYMVAQAYEKKDDYGGKSDEYGEKRGYDKSGEGRCGMSMADTDKDGRVSRDEHARHCEVMFDKMDTNKDGYIDKDEAAKMRKMHGHRHGHRAGDRSGYGERSDSGDRSGYGGRYNDYGERAGDRELPHMKPMGE
ncbi:EF-hand domain-containing protein [Nitrosovibrio tenuis]|uniref:EF hand n=1 Tax=Nitrosovibrio tenuis TaxID=1233 RepID=A0A1H7KRI7_9PROT|nr:EF-hand domain-containing protein [Nitrosovibrio tenuis]SEK89358.1 EF hand [Nitrosovibrio tenuis]